MFSVGRIVCTGVQVGILPDAVRLCTWEYVPAPDPTAGTLLVRFPAMMVQLWRYGWVGLFSNAVLYCAYLALVAATMDPKLAMTVTFVCGVLLTFLLNRKWTFSDAGAHVGSLFRYIGVYGGAYVVNLVGLVILVDHMNYPHWLVQAALVFILAMGIFLAQRYWVFQTWRA